MKEWLLTGLRVLFIVCICYIILDPLLTKLSMSFMDKSDVYDSMVKLIPKHFTLVNYVDAYQYAKYGQVLLDTVILCALSALSQTVACTLVGYGFARFQFKGRNLLFTCVVFFMLIPTQILITPQYLNLMKAGLVGSYAPFLLMGFTATAPRCGLYIFLARQFFRGLPKEIDEAAMIDGAGSFRVFTRIMLQSAIPMMVTIALFAFVWQWGDNTYTSLFHSGLKVLSNTISALGYNVQQSMNRTGFQYVSMMDYDAYFAVIYATLIIMTIAPLVLLYIFAQKRFIESIENAGIVG